MPTDATALIERAQRIKSNLRRTKAALYPKQDAAAIHEIEQAIHKLEYHLGSTTDALDYLKRYVGEASSVARRHPG